MILQWIKGGVGSTDEKTVHMESSDGLETFTDSKRDGVILSEITQC